MEVSLVSSLCSHRTNPGLPATGAGDSLPPAGFLHLQLSCCLVVTSLRILCSQVLLRDALSLTGFPRPATPGLGRLLSRPPVHVLSASTIHQPRQPLALSSNPSAPFPPSSAGSRWITACIFNHVTCVCQRSANVRASVGPDDSLSRSLDFR
ncbi:hypothetical protein BJY01DRAFT_67328 [Aspergillus pseudoustus]|uniref:Uncharacterized protein n=1 Tax=Aspergillus pseudoustus TaxID=1810923 RepID=A0ABR4J6X8_9EURO